MIHSINTTMIVDCGSCGKARFIGQIVIEPDPDSSEFSSEGDSGAVVLESESFTPVGLLFAKGDGISVANNIFLVI